MSSDLLKTLTVSLTSSFCTALFVVACTAGAEKPPETSAEDGEWGSDAGDDGGSDVGGGGGDVDAATLAALELRVAELENFQSSALCFIGHMTDVQYISPYDGEWTESEVSKTWKQGPESDSKFAYNDCF
tara:strand:+ start:57 stop:446 length:390 start_codon:yes stop_codon:yes gene_type:complete